MTNDRRHLYFHAPCFDGVVCAVLAADYAEMYDDSIAWDYRAVSYELKPRWLATRLPPRSVVVDFLYHPDAWLWADHHATSFATEDVQRVFESRREPLHFYDPCADSCAGLLQRRLTALGHRNPAYDEHVVWAEKTDAARYSSVHEAIDAEAPALRIHASLGVNADARYCAWLVRALRVKPLAEVARHAEVVERFQQRQLDTVDGLRRFEKSQRMEPDGIVVFDVDDPQLSINRYAPYVFHPDARYSIGILRGRNVAKISAMRNPWREFPSVHLGRIFESKGGGGHHRVGSLYLKGEDIALARQYLQDILLQIRDPRVIERRDDGNDSHDRSVQLF